MGQAQASEDEEVDFQPWEGAAVACLPEHSKKIAQALATGGATLRNNLQNVSPEKVNQVILEKPVAWNSVLYVLAVGRGTREGLPSDCVPALLSILRGHKETDRYLAEAAMLSLARLYAGSRDRVISENITDMWESHEISNLRDAAMLSLNLIGNEDMLIYVNAMNKIDEITDKDTVWRFCKDADTIPPARISGDFFDESLSMQRRMRERVFSILRLKNDAGLANIGSQADQVMSDLHEIVLLNGVDDRLVLQAALATLIAHKGYFEKAPIHVKENALAAVRDIAQISAYREVRNAAKKVLKEFNDPFNRAFEVFANPKNTPNFKLEREALKKELDSKFPEFTSLNRSPMAVLNNQFYGDFEKLWDHVISDPTSELGYETTKIYDTVMLFYFALHVEEWPTRMIRKFLASNNMFYRYIGMIHIGVGRLMQHRKAVVHILDTDSISDVRDCSKFILAQLPEEDGKMVPSESGKFKVPRPTWGTSDKEDLLDMERSLVVRDCAPDRPTTDDAIKAYLKKFNLSGASLSSG